MINALHSLVMNRFSSLWQQFSHPSESSLSNIILSILVFVESVVCIFWIFILSGLGEGYALMAGVPYLYIVVSYVSLLIFYRSKKFEYLTFTQLVMLLVMPFFMQWAIGGFEASSGIAIWAILSPIGALMMLGTRQSSSWFLMFALLSILSWKLNNLFVGNALPIPKHIKELFFVMNIMGAASILYAMMRYFQSQKERSKQALELEQLRSEKLLLNIMPESVASRLKDNARVADGFDSVTILFADIEDFTRLTADMKPTALVEMLSQLFSRFDALAAELGLEKIKTIGDGYMVVGGAPVARPDHAQVVAKLALNMQRAIRKFNLDTGHQFKIRIGISTGPVVAGVIGTSKFSYDVWGDSVNMASRMETTGLANEIQVSEATYAIIKTEFQLEHRGIVYVKGKGEVNAYLLKG
jgi:adenylate cyclase